MSFAILPFCFASFPSLIALCLICYLWFSFLSSYLATFPTFYISFLQILPLFFHFGFLFYYALMLAISLANYLLCTLVSFSFVTCFSIFFCFSFCLSSYFCTCPFLVPFLLCFFWSALSSFLAILFPLPPC